MSAEPSPHGTPTRYAYDATRPVDPLGDVEEESKRGTKHNRAKVVLGRPSSLLYTYGPGAVMDLPHFTVMPCGLDEWDRIWRRRDGIREIHAPRLRSAVRSLLGSDDLQLRPFPWQPKKSRLSTEGSDLGVPSRVFPQWLRCTGCDMLGGLAQFYYQNTHPFRTDLASFEHQACPGRKDFNRRGKRSGRSSKAARHTAVPARYLLACPVGHVDEFPYDLWVHGGSQCGEAEFPALKMVEGTSGRGATASIHCASCDKERPMNEAQGEVGRTKLPRCRGRHPHLDAFDAGGCGVDTYLILIGASNLWFPATQSVIVMPESAEERAEDRADQIRRAIGEVKAAKYRDTPDILRDVLAHQPEIMFDPAELSDAELTEAAAAAAVAAAPPPTAEEQERRRLNWDPVDLLVPEWRYLQREPIGAHHTDNTSGLVLSARERGSGLPPTISRVLAVESLRKVNALLGFTRIDDMERVGDLPGRLVPLTRAERQQWTVATEDYGEGIFLTLDEHAVAAWERRVENSPLWAAHRAAHTRNFNRRFSDTAAEVSADSRLRAPRYWLLHTFAHVLIREMAMTCGYNAASLSERLYAWPKSEGREPAAGLLICTTASDSDGTLGGLVQLADPDRLDRAVNSALRRALRCPSDPVCAVRTPQDPEDFLHGAACHCCAMASETSCERANRFLDRRFLIDLPGSDLGFFTPPTGSPA